MWIIVELQNLQINVDQRELFLKDGDWTTKESWSCCLVMDGRVMFSDAVAIV